MKWYFLLFFFVMFVLILVSYFMFRETIETKTTQTKETFADDNDNTHIQFLSKHQFTKILLENKDNYYNTFHKNDLKIRNVKSVKDYEAVIRNSTCNGTKQLQQKIIRCIRIVENKLRQIEHKTKHGIVIRKFLEIPWKFGFTCDRKYENGYPHTRSDIIVINVTEAFRRPEKSLCELLIHEKTHVYQKLYKSEMDAYFKSKGYRVVDTKTTDKTNIPANPDIDSNIYDDLETKFKFYAKYRKNPSSFRDITYSNDHAKNEHPLEKIAYAMETIL